MPPITARAGILISRYFGRDLVTEATSSAPPLFPRNGQNFTITAAALLVFRHCYSALTRNEAACAERTGKGAHKNCDVYENWMDLPQEGLIECVQV